MTSYSDGARLVDNWNLIYYLPIQRWRSFMVSFQLSFCERYNGSDWGFLFFVIYFYFVNIIICLCDCTILKVLSLWNGSILNHSFLYEAPWGLKHWNLEWKLANAWHLLQIFRLMLAWKCMTSLMNGKCLACSLSLCFYWSSFTKFVRRLPKLYSAMWIFLATMWIVSGFLHESICSTIEKF